MNTLLMLVGLPRAGKSSWAREQGYPIVNPDSIRLALHGQSFYAPAEPMVWALAKAMVRSLFLAGHETVILDATNVNKRRRNEWQSKEWLLHLQIFTTSPRECIRRAREDGREDLVPVIERMAKEWDLPQHWEEEEMQIEICRLLTEDNSEH